MWNYINSDRNSFQMIYTVSYSIGMQPGISYASVLDPRYYMQSTKLSSGKIYSTSIVYRSLLLMFVIHVVDLY